MVSMLRDTIGARGTSAWLPLVATALLVLYLLAFVDGTVHGQAIAGDVGLKVNYVHEFVHHARHVFVTCH